MSAKKEAALLRHILAKGDCSTHEDTRSGGGIVLIDSGWVSVSAEQMSVWKAMQTDVDEREED